MHTFKMVRVKECYSTYVVILYSKGFLTWKERSSFYKTFQMLFWTNGLYFYTHAAEKKRKSQGYEQHFHGKAIRKLLLRWQGCQHMSLPFQAVMLQQLLNATLPAPLLNRWILHLHLHSNVIMALKLNAQSSKCKFCADVSRWTECAVTTQHQHKASYFSALRAQFCHQCLIKLQAKMYILCLQWFSRFVTNIPHRFTGLFSIILFLTFYISIYHLYFT